jgi:predicted nucleotidyltransferase
MSGVIRHSRDQAPRHSLEGGNPGPGAAGAHLITGLEEIVKRIVEAAQPERIIVFGSAARGDDGPESDLDLLIVKAGQYRKREMAVKVRRAIGSTGRPIDLIVARPEDLRRYGDTPGLVYGAALRDGREVYRAA